MRKGEGFGFGGAGFGIPGAQGADWPGDAATMARRFWDTLTTSMRDTRGAAPAGDLWRSAMDGWSQLAGMAGGGGRDDLGATVERFSAQARQWFAGMQQVAESFGGRQASPGDIVQAWKQAMGGAGDNPFASLFNAMPGRGHAGFDQWYAQVGPMLKAMGLGLQGGALSGLQGMGLQGMGLPGMGADGFAGLRREWSDLLQLPAFGMNREHEERLRALLDAQLELQRANDAYNVLMLRAGHDAFDRFERKLAERSEPGRQLKSARALFDLWIDAAEEAYAEIALSHEFRSAYGALVNAQMRVRAGVQREVESLCAQFGMPTRTEVDSAHRRIAELERQLRRMRNASTSPAAKPAPVVKPAAKPAARKASADVVGTPDTAAPDSTAAGDIASPAPAVKPVAKPAVKPAVKPAAKAARKPATKSVAKAAARPVAKAASAKRATAKTASTRARTARADAATASRRAARPAIAIAMPEPLQPLPPVAEGRSAGASAGSGKTTRTSVKRTR